MEGYDFMQEKEIKVLLSKDKYDFINSDFKWNKYLIQTNYYYRDLSSAENSNVTIRVRQYGDKYTLQVKVPVTRNNAVHVNNEYEIVLPDVPVVISSDMIFKLSGVKMGDCTNVGSLTTRRKIFAYNDLTLICLDENTYFDITDYELEIEYKDEVDEKLLEFFRSNIGDISKSAVGKYTRFLNEYVKRNAIIL